MKNINNIDINILNKANEEIIFNAFMSLTKKYYPKSNESFFTTIKNLTSLCENNLPQNWNEREKYLLNVIIKSTERNKVIANSIISEFSCTDTGMCVGLFYKSKNDISIVFRGTGDGEWIDNGEGLSGIGEENIYYTYNNDSSIKKARIVENDYSTDQQTEALNWFNKISKKYRWNETTNIIISGHSKGGNKAQFITVNSPLIKLCFNFNGQGFSPEAIEHFKKIYKDEYDNRIKKIFSFSAENDYVNILGNQIIPENQRFYLKAKGFHFIDALIDENGYLYPQCKKGNFAKFIENVSEDLMKLPPKKRKNTTLSVMNLCQKFLGKSTPVNNDYVSTQLTIYGLIITIKNILKTVFNKNDK